MSSYADFYTPLYSSVLYWFAILDAYGSPAVPLYLDVGGLGHLAQQAEGLALEGLVGVLQAVDDGHLVLLRKLRVDAHHRPQRVHADVLQVV
jgi:hypothetical protein